jgi:Fe-S-cluster containining protein
MSRGSKERRAKERASAVERQHRLRRRVLERWGPSAPEDRVERAGYLAAHAVLEESGLTPAGVRDVGFNCASFTNGTLAPQLGDPSYACAPGCAWCCMLEASAWPSEVIELASFVESRRAEEVAPLLARLRETVALSDGQRAAGRWPRVTCPLLSSDRTCSVHDVRPSSCAAACSFDAARCKAYAEGTEEKDRIAANFALLAPSRMAAHVIMERGGPRTDAAGGALDLHAGLAIALERGALGAAAAWLAGEDVFREARERSRWRMERLAAEMRARSGPGPQGLVTLGRPPAKT